MVSRRSSVPQPVVPGIPINMDLVARSDLRYAGVASRRLRSQHLQTLHGFRKVLGDPVGGGSGHLSILGWLDTGGLVITSPCLATSRMSPATTPACRSSTSRTHHLLSPGSAARPTQLCRRSRGGYAFVAGNAAGLLIITFPTPNPTPERTTPPAGIGVAVSKLRLRRRLLRPADVMSPAPRLTHRRLIRPASPMVCGLGSYAYVADNYAGLQIINVSTRKPHNRGNLQHAGPGPCRSRLGDYAYIADDDAGLQISTYPVLQAPHSGNRHPG